MIISLSTQSDSATLYTTWRFLESSGEKQHRLIPFITKKIYLVCTSNKTLEIEIGLLDTNYLTVTLSWQLFAA